MKKNILLFLVPLLFCMATEAKADEKTVENFCSLNEKNFYGKIFGGANLLQNTALNGNKSKYDMGYIVSGSLGICSCYSLRLECEYSFRRNSIRKIHFFGQGSSKKGHFQTSSSMANLLWDLPLRPRGYPFCNTLPFIGAGIGYDFEQMHSSNSRIDFHQKWNHFAWQLMAGLAHPISCNTEITFEYKFHQGGCHFYNHSIGLGLVYKFQFLR